MVKARTALPLAFVVAVTGCWAEARYGSALYTVDGKRYRVPHTYDRHREGQPAWLAAVSGLDTDNDAVLSLDFPAGEAAKGIAGYSRTFPAFTGPGDNVLSVTVIGGQDAREFRDDRISDLAELARWRASPAESDPDPETGWQRVFDPRGAGREAGIPAYFLLPHRDGSALPANWRVPRCNLMRDRAGRSHAECRYEISQGGLSYAFTLYEGSLAAAAAVPGFVRGRMEAWRK